MVPCRCWWWTWSSVGTSQGAAEDDHRGLWLWPAWTHSHTVTAAAGLRLHSEHRPTHPHTWPSNWRWSGFPSFKLHRDKRDPATLLNHEGAETQNIEASLNVNRKPSFVLGWRSHPPPYSASDWLVIVAFVGSIGQIQAGGVWLVSVRVSVSSFAVLGKKIANNRGELTGSALFSP